MTRSHSIRRSIAALALAALVSLPARAENKDMIQLQTQVQALQDAIAKLQQTNDESFGMLKALIQQTADSVNTMSTTVNGLKLSMQNQQDAVSASNQQVSGQVQSLNDSIDELKARMARMEKALNAIQNQQQATNATLSSLPQGGAAPAGPPQAAPNASPNQGTAPDSGTDNSNNNPPSNTTSQPIPANSQPSPGDMYRGAYADDNLSGNAWYYLGEMQMRTHKPALAIKDYDQVITRYVDNAKVPAAQLHKAQALIDTHQNEAAERELHSLIQRFPVSPEASQARAKLNTLRAPGQ